MEFHTVVYIIFSSLIFATLHFKILETHIRNIKKYAYLLPLIVERRKIFKFFADAVCCATGSIWQSTFVTIAV